MIRLAIVLALLLSSAAMMRGVAGDWQKGFTLPSDSASTKETSVGEVAVSPQSPPLQPVVPDVLPDLKDGYLFNQDRMLAGTEPLPLVEEEDADTAEDTTGIAAKMDDVSYAGSIIADNFSRALIVYTEAEKSKAPAQRTARSSKVKAPTPQGGEKHAQLEVGDLLDGYQVAEIQPDKLIFTKGDETVEKLLYDPEKKRQDSPPRLGAMPPGGGGMPRPAGIQSTTIGGAASLVPPVPGGVNPPIPPAPTAVSPPIPPAPVTSPKIKNPFQQAATGGSSAAPPVRRMVISRQPSTAARPDTSRVIRQTLGGSDNAIPLPPGFGGNTNNSMATPPMPGGN